MNKQNVCFARAYGEPREVGAEIGRQRADEIMDVLAALGVPEGLGEGECDCCGMGRKELLGNIEKQAPDLLAEMDGLADGAGVPGASLLLLNWMMQPRGVRAAALAFEDAPGGPAIALALGTSTDAPLCLAVTAIDVPGKAQVLQIGAPGLVGCVAGVNSHGIALGVVPMASGEGCEDGIPSLMVARRVLDDARTLDEAMEILGAAKIACCPFDAIVADKERVLLAERGVNDMTTRKPVDGAVWAATDDASRARLAKIAAEKPHTAETAEEALGDCEEPGAICPAEWGEGALAMGAVLRPRARVIELAAGEPCKTKFRPFQLKLAVTGAGSHLAGEYQT